MHPILILIQLAAAVMLLLWAVHMLRGGVERLWAEQLRAVILRARSNMIPMAASGMVLAILLQSSTAVGVLSAGFASSGILSVGAGITALLGADLGSALVVKILSFDLSEVVSLILLVGATISVKSKDPRRREFGTIILGIGFVLLSLSMVAHATEPLRHNPTLPRILSYFNGDPLSAFVVAALLTWGLHSSIATLLLLAHFAAAGVLSIEAALPMVLGCNLGAGIIAVWLTRNLDLTARRIPLGNLLFRAGAALVVLMVLFWWPLPITQLGQGAAVQLINFHVLFNVALLAFALPFAHRMDRLTARIWAAPQQASDSAPRYRTALDPTLLDQPRLARHAITRELLIMGEALAEMLRPAMAVIASKDSTELLRLRSIDKEIDQRHAAIKNYAAAISRVAPPEAGGESAMQLATVAIDFGHIADQIAFGLLRLAERRQEQQVDFSEAGWQELTGLHERIYANLQLALHVLTSGDLQAARELANEKSIIRALEGDSQKRHLLRLQSSDPDSLASSQLHLEALRLLKEINSLIVRIAYPILQGQGELLESRVSIADSSSAQLMN